MLDLQACAWVEVGIHTHIYRITHMALQLNQCSGDSHFIMLMMSDPAYMLFCRANVHSFSCLVPVISNGQRVRST